MTGQEEGQVLPGEEGPGVPRGAILHARTARLVPRGAALHERIALGEEPQGQGPAGQVAAGSPHGTAWRSSTSR